MQNGGCLKIALALRAWPRQGFKLKGVDLGFHFKDLGLLEKPVECNVVHDVFAYWHWPKSDMTPNTALALEHFCTSLEKVTLLMHLNSILSVVVKVHSFPSSLSSLSNHSGWT